MSDFDDQAHAAGDRARRLGAEIAAAADPMANVDHGPREHHHRRRPWLLTAAAILVVAGVGGLIVAGGRNSADVTETETVPASTTERPVTTENPTTTERASTTTAAPTTTIEAAPTPITRPIVDPAICTPISAFEDKPSGLPRDPSVGLPLTLFARPSELPVPIQVIGESVDGQAEPFALVLRYFDRPADATGQLDPVIVNGTEMFVRDFGNRNGSAEWTLPDGSMGYLRSRDLDRDQLIAILERLTPRPADALIPGFDYDGGAPDGLSLVAERMNTGPKNWSAAGSQCVVESTGFVHQIVAITGDPTLRFAAVIDRHIPADVGVVDGTVVIVSGPPASSGPSASDVIDADEATWQALLQRPAIVDGVVELITVGDDVDVPFVALGDPATPISSLTLRIEETDGVAFLEIYLDDAVIADAAEYWKIEVDGRIRLRSTAIPGAGAGVMGQRLGDAPITTPFTVRISTTDSDDQTIQTTGDVRLVPTWRAGSPATMDT